MKKRIGWKILAFAFVVVLAANSAAEPISKFVIKDDDTGNEWYTATGAVVVELEDALPDGVTAVGWYVTQPDEVPPHLVDPEFEWPPLPPLYTFDVSVQPRGITSLIAYMLDSNGVDYERAATIVYDDRDPIVYDDETLPSVYSIQVNWKTGLPNGEFPEPFQAMGWVEYSLAGADSWQMAGPSGYGFAHEVVITGLMDETAYDIRINSNGTQYLKTASTSAASPVTGNLTWTGGAGLDDQRWSRGSNWSAGSPPALNTTGVMTFGAAGSIIEEITSVLNPQALDEEADTWQIGGLTIADLADHTMDLNENTLKIMGTTTFSTASTSMKFQNGTLQIGEAGGTLRNITHRGKMIIAPGATLNAAALGTLNFSGSGQNVRSPLNLEGASITNRVLVIGSLNMGNSNADVEFRMNNNTGLDLIHVTGNAVFGRGQRCRAYFGVEADDWRLPHNLSLKFGVGPEGEDPGTRSNLWIGSARDWHYVLGKIEAAQGGTCEAWLNELDVGSYHYTRNESNTGYGTLNLRAMTDVNIDATTIMTGYYVNRQATKWKANGVIRLKGAQVRADDVVIGSIISGASGLIEIDDTSFKVDNSLLVDTTGTLRIDVASTGNGLDLDEETAVTVVQGGVIEVNFNEAPAGGGVHWGIRAEGNRSAELGQLLADGYIQMFIPFQDAIPPEERQYVALVFEEGGYTYAGLVDATVSTVTPRDLVREVLPGGTLTISGGDAFVTAYHPDDSPIVEKYLSVDGGDEEESLTLSTPAVLPAVYDMTLTVYFEDETSASAEFTLTLVELSESTADNVTWVGGAFLELDPRKEWFWGGNWDGGKPPANPTAATVYFRDSDLSDTVAKLLAPIPDADGQPTDTWTIGNFRAGNTTGRHILDLGGKTLDVSGELRVQRYDQGNADMAIKNGTLSIGTDLFLYNNSRLDLSEMGGTPLNIANTLRVNSGGQLTLAGGITLPGSLYSLEVGTSGTASLDLRGTQIVGGTLELENLVLGGGNAYGDLYIDADTFQTLKVLQKMHLNAEGQRGQARIGTDDTWYLPYGTNIYVGEDAENRGELIMANSGGYLSNRHSYLRASGGGEFEAWLTTFTVANTWGTQEGPMRGTLDLRGVDEFFLDALTARIGTNTGTQRVEGRAYLPAGNATVGTLIIGDSVLTSVSLLELHGTDFSIRSSATLNETAEVVINVGDTSCGLDLPEFQNGDPESDPFALTIADGGVIKINFIEIPAHEGIHYGLKWESDKEAELLALAAADKLVVDTSALADYAPVWDIEYDETSNATYVALTVTVPDYPVYAFSYDVPDATYADTDVVVPVTFATVEEGTLPYGNVRFAFEAAGPEGSIVTFTSGEYTVENSGYWPGDEEGFELPLQYTDTTDWTLNFSDVGEYTIAFRCYVVEDDGLGNPIEGATIAEDSMVVSVEEIPLYGDANGDDSVDLLDLVFVRNRLFQPIGEGDNAQADINDDNAVDLEDLIEVRNNLGAVR